jgi:hypothetical protein
VAAVEGQLYEVPAEDNTFLLVNLSPAFPEEPPVITLSPTGMRHPWVDSDVIMHDALNTWNPSSSNLGQLVKEIRDEFLQRPPAKKTSNNETEGYGYRAQPPIPTAATTNPEYAAIAKLR